MTQNICYLCEIGIFFKYINACVIFYTSSIIVREKQIVCCYGNNVAQTIADTDQM